MSKRRFDTNQESLAEHSQLPNLPLPPKSCLWQPFPSLIECLWQGKEEEERLTSVCRLFSETVRGPPESPCQKMLTEIESKSLKLKIKRCWRKHTRDLKPNVDGNTEESQTWQESFPGAAAHSIVSLMLSLYGGGAALHAALLTMLTFTSYKESLAS